MRLFYIGNMGSKTPTTIDTLTPLLRPIVAVQSSSSFRNKLLRLLDMMWTVSKAKPRDLILIDVYSSSAFYYAWACGLLSRLRKVKYIAYAHGGNLPQRIDKNLHWQNNFFAKASLIIAPSKFLQEAIAKRGYGPVRYIPNSIKIVNYPFRQREKIRPRILWVRSLNEAYNPKMAIRVLSALQKENKDAFLCMVGPDKGSLDECRSYAASLGLAHCIQLTGMLSRAQWIEISRDYDVFINTTNFDNTPVSVIEAMALGFPVVSTNVGGIPYLLNHGVNCLLVDKNDDEAMVQSIRHLMTDAKTAQSLSRSARATAEQFDWEQVKTFWIDVLNR